MAFRPVRSSQGPCASGPANGADGACSRAHTRFHGGVCRSRTVQRMVKLVPALPVKALNVLHLDTGGPVDGTNWRSSPHSHQWGHHRSGAKPTCKHGTSHCSEWVSPAHGFGAHSSPPSLHWRHTPYPIAMCSPPITRRCAPHQSPPCPPLAYRLAPSIALSLCPCRIACLPATRRVHSIVYLSTQPSLHPCLRALCTALFATLPYSPSEGHSGPGVTELSSGIRRAKLDLLFHTSTHHGCPGVTVSSMGIRRA